MSESPERITEQQLESYLDGRLSTEERVEFEQRLANDPTAANAVETQRELDALARAFSPPHVTTEFIKRIVQRDSRPAVASKPATSKSIRRQLIAVATAIVTSVVWAVVAWQWGDRAKLEPFFEPRPLSAIYRETVSQGFRPYYFCEDENRFAMTFAKRQHVPLRLARMPDDRRMVGLSYVGGLSRDTTAVLCYFQNQPVIVFVDVRNVDNPAIAMADVEPSLHVHRHELDDLVIYEVGPLQDAKFVEYLREAD